jgi:hypothetical protein
MICRVVLLPVVVSLLAGLAGATSQPKTFAVRLPSTTFGEA